MDLDWCNDRDLKDAEQFNTQSVITYEKKITTQIKEEVNIIKNDVRIENCFNQNLNVTNGKDLLNILNYLSIISNYLRTFMRNKSLKFNDSILITQLEYESVLNYLNWLKKSCDTIKNYFALPLRRDNSYDPSNIKPFKTSSYKFCNFKESCSIHRNKNKTCDKNHFVFEMIINDIDKLIESIILLDLENLNWVLNNKYLKVLYDKDNTQIEKLNNNLNNELVENCFIIDKSLIFKSFDVISFVLNKMYEESYSFLNFGNDSILINI